MSRPEIRDEIYSVDTVVPSATVAKWALALGATLALLGGLAIAAPWVAATVVDAICAGVLVAGGVAQLAAATATRSWRGFWLTLLCGALSVVAGTAMLAIPVAGVHVLATFLGLVILFEAAAKLTAAFSVPRDFPWGWLLVDGIVTTLLGGFLLLSSPAQAGTLLGIIVGFNLLSSGLSLLAAGIWLKRA
jgi:uncharacterized membrane protein HdeD (DUF308 family)